MINTPGLARMYQWRAVCICTSKSPPYGAAELAKGSPIMRRIRSFAAQTPALVISVLAVALSVGGGAYASTHMTPGPSQGPVHTLQVAHSEGTARSLTAGVSWNSVVLQNGWVSSNSSFATGNPKVALQGNIVYLSGSLHQPTPGSAVFGFLPSTFRPVHNMFITVYTNGSTTGTLYIGKDGTMEAFASGACGSGNTAQCFTSLATVSYPINS